MYETMDPLIEYTSKTLTHSECGISRTAFGYVQRTDRGYTWMDIKILGNWWFTATPDLYSVCMNLPNAKWQVLSLMPAWIVTWVNFQDWCLIGSYFALYEFLLVTDSEFKSIQCGAGIITTLNGGTTHKTMADTFKSVMLAGYTWQRRYGNMIGD
jgi:hypothetical protein